MFVEKGSHLVKLLLSLFQIRPQCFLRVYANDVLTFLFLMKLCQFVPDLTQGYDRTPTCFFLWVDMVEISYCFEAFYVAELLSHNSGLTVFRIKPFVVR